MVVMMITSFFKSIHIRFENVLIQLASTSIVK